MISKILLALGCLANKWSCFKSQSSAGGGDDAVMNELAKELNRQRCVPGTLASLQMTSNSYYAFVFACCAHE